jgi:threonine dehydrogenase-like Zn-dependent dehydrogenase
MDPDLRTAQKVAFGTAAVAGVGAVGLGVAAAAGVSAVGVGGTKRDRSNY